MTLELPTDENPVVVIEGDALEVMPLLPKGCIDAVITSPPYNQMASVSGKPSGMWAKTTGGVGFVRNWFETGYADDMPELEYQAWQNGAFASAGYLSGSASLFYNHQIRWRNSECLHPVKWFQPKGWNLRQEIIWDRGGGMMMNARAFCRFEERILWFVRGKKWKWNQSSVGDGSIWRIAREQQQQGKLHPVAYPIEIPRRCLLATTDPCDIILDPFAGSGTTGVAAILEGRKAILIEKDPAYAAIARRRIAQALGDGPGTLIGSAKAATLFDGEASNESQ